MDAIAELMAREQIRDALYRYFHGLDRGDWAMVLGACHNDAIEVHGELQGTVKNLLESNVIPRYANIIQSMHALTNILIEFVGDDHALVESYCIAEQTVRRPDRSLDSVRKGNRYVDIFTHRTSQWKLSRREVVREWARTESGNTWEHDLERQLTARDTDDLYFKVKQAIVQR